MSLFACPVRHAAHPPSTWRVVKVAERTWDLVAGKSTLNRYTTKRAAEQARTRGWLVDLYDRERRWYAGEPVRGWKPYKGTD